MSKPGRQCNTATFHLTWPVVPHNAAAENLSERWVVVMHGSQSEPIDGPKDGWGSEVLSLSPSLPLSLYVTFCVSFCVCASLSFFLCIYLSCCPSICLRIYPLSIWLLYLLSLSRPFMYWSINLTVCLSDYLTIFLSDCLTLCLLICLSNYVSIDSI